MLGVLKCGKSTWEGEDDVEASGSDEWGKPALPSIQ